jgi:thiamine biosynthesis lipoprotein
VIIDVAETRASFPCFGGRVALVASSGQDLISLRALFEGWHRRLTRFDPTSELSLLNADPREQVRVSALMACFVAAAIDAADRTDGLVDPTLVGEIEAAGYRADLGKPVDLAHSLDLAPPRQPARPHPARRWLDVSVDPASRTVIRPPGVRLDSGGIAKGLFADLAAERLTRAGSFAVDCCGDVRVGGRDGLPRPVLVDDPFGRGEPLHEFRIVRGGAATSGIGRRSWIGPDGLPKHHLLDPSTGQPAYTGIVQATALAPTAADAEVRSKAALLSHDPAWLAHGGVLVFDDGSHMVVDQP